MKIAALLISTSHGRSWKSMQETYLYNVFAKTFLRTIDSENTIIVYIGIDSDDKLLNDQKEQQHLQRFSQVFKNVEFKFIVLPSNIAKGHVTAMWNVVHKQAYEDGCDYFYQCGDDIHFRTNGWVNDCIVTLRTHDDIGITGPINNNNRILTQSFVSRKHMEIFGFYFPESIKNWCCDDWYNWVYQPDYFYPLRNHYCSNDGGAPRYVINNNARFRDNLGHNTDILRKRTFELAKQHRNLVATYVNHQRTCVKDS